MSDEATTKLTLETLSKQVQDLRNEMRAGMEELRNEMRAGFAAVNHMFEQMDIRFDRIESVACGAHAQTLTLRADFKEFRSRFKESA